jgi:RNA polymerase sigma-70 factor (ECF subfamily)
MKRQAAGQFNSEPLLQSFDAFYRQEYRSIVALAAVISGSRWAAEDLAQEAFSAAYQEWDRVKGFEFPHLWVRRVVANKSTSLVRRSIAEAKARSRLLTGRPALDQMPDESEDVWDAVRRLPRRQTQAIALIYLSGLTVDEASVVLGCSAGTVKTHLKRGRATLGRRLEATGRLAHDG